MKFWWNDKKKSSEPFDVMIEMLRKGNNPWAEDTSLQTAYSIMSDITLKSSIKNRGGVIANFSNDGLYQQGNETIMLALVLNHCTWDIIATGRYHFYRGILTGTGEELKQLFHSTMRFVEDKGILDKEVKESWITALYADIAQVG